MDEAGIQTYTLATGNLTGSATTQYNVLVGDANNKLTNVAPSATSGVPLISQGAASNPAFGTAVVAGGGTGNTTFTAYAVITAGTTATGAFQNVSGVGTSGQVLTSNGAGTLPTWQAAAAGGALVFYVMASSGNPADTIVYFLSTGQTFTSLTASSAASRLYMPRAGTINICYGDVSVSGTLGSNQNCTLALRKNNTTDTSVTTTLQLTAADNTFNNTTLGITVVAGDFLEFKFTSPTWTTNPTTVRFTATFQLD